MPGFTQTEEELVDRAYELANQRIANLDECNEKRHSEIRQVAIETLKAYLEPILNLGFRDREDFSLAEIAATVEAANAIIATEEQLEHAHELTLMELESDLAQLVQKVALDGYRGMLIESWRYARRTYESLPRQIPQDVCDDFNVGVFNKTQGKLNLIVYHTQNVARLKCLNSDDYAPIDFTVAEFNASKLSAKEAAANYVTLQRLKQAERAAHAANDISIGGQVWSVLGWDSPTDFLKDLVLTALTGGASKIVKWARRLKKARDEAKLVSKSLSRLLKVRDRAQSLERRVIEIRQTAERLKKARKFIDVPKRVVALFARLEKAHEQVKLLRQVGEVASMNYIRSVVSSVAVGATALGGSMHVGTAASKEMARMSVVAFLDGTPLGTNIKDLRSKVNFTMLIASAFDERNMTRLMFYFGLLTTREFVARMAISLMHKVSLSGKLIVEVLIDSAAAAVETMLLDVPILAEAQLKMLGRTIMSTIRKYVGEIGKKLANELLAA